MDTEGRGISDRDQQSRAYRFIAEYSLRKGEDKELDKVVDWLMVDMERITSWIIDVQFF